MQFSSVLLPTRALAYARFADQGHDLACRDAEIERTEQRPAGSWVTLGKTANGQHVRAGRS